MAEIEEAIELTEVAEDGIDEEAEAAENELDPEEAEELQEEVKVAKGNVSTLRSVADYIKGLEIPGALKTFSDFVVKNVAIGAICYGVNIFLSKLSKQSKAASGGDSKAAQAKYKKIKALSTLINDMTKTSQKAMQWLKEHEKDTVDLDGISVPLVDIFTKYTRPMGDSVDKAYAVAKKLLTKNSKGKDKFNVPTTAQVDTIVDSVKDFVAALDGFYKFAREKQSKYPKLKTLTVTCCDIHKLSTDLKAVKSMPYY